MSRSMKINDYDALGRLIIHWSKSPGCRPKTVGAFREEVGTSVELTGYDNPDEKVSYKELSKNSGPLELSIPAAEDIPTDIESYYEVPEFYGRLAFGGDDPVVSKDNWKEMLNSRIADYASSKCM